ncbi:DUF397 domain-containing protein [Streptomyces sp. JV176]|uniref:DUF397 domain-containing protein n=1 Tax=Streptomyces sp. JV176 TaxID=858630 RepID=UPI002E75DB95|nr:DUF397 domain-containing protein [Streptomyces sp. JV176]MEE1798230.1 DUF397 domain-containing protein [Streptomyces sp. JV176]
MNPQVVGPYQKSSYSGHDNNCVEVAPIANGGRAVRDSKDHTRRPLGFTPAQWGIFLAYAKAEAS